MATFAPGERTQEGVGETMTAEQGYANPAALVSTQWVVDHLNDQSVRLLEVDVDTSAYGQGHIQGAVGINWTTQLGDPVRRDIPSPEAWGKLLRDRKSTRLNSSHSQISYAVFCLKKKILDVNRLGQRGETMHGWNTTLYAERAVPFGWNAIVIDGHNSDEINQAFARASQPNGTPTVIIAKTIKGKGVSFLENVNGWHGKALNKEQEEQALNELHYVRSQTFPVQKPENLQPAPEAAKKALELPKYDGKEAVATRKAYGDALQALGAADPDVVGLDGEVSNSTYAEEFAKAFPDRFFEQYIAEEQLVASAVGMSVRHKIPFASTFAAFFSLAYDFIRMAAISRANIRLSGSHAGVSIGEDGPSQMALEDLSMMRAVYGSTVVYPSD